MMDDHDLVNLSAVRAAKAKTPRDWQPRDVLESVMRRIDSGEINPDSLIVCFRETLGPGRTATGYEQASPDVHTSLGVLDFVSKRMYEGSK